MSMFTFRPLGPWVEGNTKARRTRYAFKAHWSSTVRLLERELDHLAARRVVVQADFTERDIRQDGLPRANARQPVHPGVRVAFDSRHGPLTYATDAYEFWQHNVRAIALGLEALRAVDRYGVTRRGEQYTGWKQLPSGIPVRAAMTVDEAAAFVLTHSGAAAASDAAAAASMVLIAPDSARLFATYYRDAAKRLHPDAGGDTALFQRLQEAKRVLEGGAG